MIVMRTYVINLKRRSDRRERMQAILPKGLQVEFTTDGGCSLDSKEITSETLRMNGFALFPWQIESDNKWWNRPLKKGEVGCSISHWLCWCQAVKTSDNIFMILEEDVYFIEDFMGHLDSGLERLNLYDPKWDIIYLGRVPLDQDEPVIDIVGIVRPGYSHCTYAYLLTHSGVNKLLNARFEKELIPVDEFLPAMYIDHPREDVKQRYPKRLSAYAFEPPIAFQLPKAVAGSDTEESDFII